MLLCGLSVSAVKIPVRFRHRFRFRFPYFRADSTVWWPQRGAKRAARPSAATKVERRGSSGLRSASPRQRVERRESAQENKKLLDSTAEGHDRFCECCAFSQRHSLQPSAYSQSADSVPLKARTLVFREDSSDTRSSVSIRVSCTTEAQSHREGSSSVGRTGTQSFSVSRCLCG